MGYQSVASVQTSAGLIRPNVFRKVIDFANVFKAFIGTNWIALPFAFRQSGVVLGSIGLFIIAILTDHCCQLIIKCKKSAVGKILRKMPKYNNPRISLSEKLELEAKVEKKMMYGDIGKVALGKPGLVLVEVSLLITQIMFCVGYFIFIGNTIQGLFVIKKTDVVNSTLANTTNTDSKDSSVPSFPLLLLIPVVPLILMAFIRRVRKLGPVSFISNLALLFAFLAVLGYMLTGWTFKLNKIRLFSWSTFPVFFGQVTSAYEGIGTLIPIESSMAENRHRYPLYLHLALGLLSAILGGFGITGYLVYGENVDQIVTSELPQGLLVTVVQILLCLAILFTYPLQLFPVTEIIESYLFKEYNRRKEEKYEAMNVAKDSVADSGTEIDSEAGDETIELVPKVNQRRLIKKKTSWRKNFLRMVLVLITAGFAILLKDDFAYVSALCGSLGSSMLAFILPCIFHIKLERGSISRLTIAKDIGLILFGVIGGGVGVTVTILEIVRSFSRPLPN